MLAYTSKLQGRQLFLKCSDNRELVTSSWEDALAFLVMPTDFAVTWNIDGFVDDITSLMPKSLRQQILKGGRVISPDRRKLYYQAGRLFGINQINFYGLSRYADEPITDCGKLLESGGKVIEAYRTFGIEPTRLTSPVSLYGEILDRLDYPRACDLPDSAFPMMEQCVPIQSREWRDVFKLGHWTAGEISDYDLTAAYPSIIAQLPDISRGKFVESKAIPQGYYWGTMTGKLKITKPVSPFICEKYKCYGTGEWPDTITTDQLWILERFGAGTFTMDYGNFLFLPEPHKYPFKATMQDLYKARESENTIVSKIAKGTSVGIGGKFAERHSDGGLGDNANPIYALMTTSRCMTKVASFIYHNQLENDLISVLVDGCLATKRLPIQNKRAMGSWRMNEPLPALVLSLEYQWQGDKKPGMVIYADLIEQIKQHPNKSSYGDVDINLTAYSRKFEKRPHTGKDLLNNKYGSVPYEIKG